jgi:ribose/xylose/arabinose/galactoside ABC-type transport system permease subunit
MTEAKAAAADAQDEAPGYPRSTVAPANWRRTAVPVAAVVVLLVALAITTPGFYASGNLLNLGQIAVILGIVTVGQMVVMVGGGLDLSVGATAGLTFFAVAAVSEGHDSRIALALAVAAGLALAVGAVNSALVALRGVPPFVATLGTLILIKGVVAAWSQGVFEGSVPEGLRRISTGHWGPLSLALIVFLVVVVVAGFALTRSVFGRHLYATGLNEEAAVYAGIRVGRVRTSAYFISALLAALAGLILGAYTGFVDPTAGQTLNLESIAAAVVGGVSLFGGRGGVVNAFAGAVLMTVVLNVGLLHGLSGQSQSVMTGVVLLIAAYVYSVRGRRQR